VTSIASGKTTEIVAVAGGMIVTAVVAERVSSV
jgi:hypothetical protein